LIFDGYAGDDDIVGASYAFRIADVVIHGEIRIVIIKSSGI
jgi:hypothetical protein